MVIIHATGAFAQKERTDTIRVTERDTHKATVDTHQLREHTDFMMTHPMHNPVPDAWLNPRQAAAWIPGASKRSVRDWCAAGVMPGAIQLPSGRWQIPWSAVVAVLGFDPAAGSSDGVGVSPFPAPPDDPDGRSGVDPLPGVEEP